jgi:hypothetical protein
LALLLYINGQLTDLDAGTVIAQTRQVNDLNSLENRQASYTNKFSLPKTANNVRIMQFLTLPGNNSPVPYQKNECSLYNASGECFVYKGWAVITDGGDSYDAVIYDGIIDLYKAIENKTLADLGLEELQHEKSIEGVRYSWNPDVPFRYILADYNGNTGLTNTITDYRSPVNIDYLVPSVSVSWLWKKIFEKFNDNVQPTGAVFNLPDFKQLFMTFPKGQVRSDSNDVSLFKSNDYRFLLSSSNQIFSRRLFYCRFMTTQLYESQWLTNNYGIHLMVLKSSSYKLKIKCKLHPHRVGNSDIPKDSFIKIGKNCNDLHAYEAGNNIINVFTTQPYVIYGQEFEVESNPFQLNAFDSICIIIGGQGTDSYTISEDWWGDEFETELIRVDADSINFSDALMDFSVKDFMNEVVHRFGLTLYKDKFSKSYTFLTLQEQLQGAATVNWTNKFDKKLSENYIYGSYAQNNFFKYAYNDKESTHNDGAISIANVNLPDTRDSIKSKIYSPERVPSQYLGESANVYKLWEKEAVDDPQPGEQAVRYKPLDKRYYFLKAQRVSGSINLISDVLGETFNPTSLYYRETYNGLNFQDIVTRYYAPLQSVLNNAVIVNVQLWLNDADIANLDFKKLYYIEQLSNYYILNKVNNYISGKVTTCELVKVAYTEVEPAMPQLTIQLLRNNSVSLSFAYTSNYNAGALTAQVKRQGNSWIIGGWTTDGQAFYYAPAQPGRYYYRVIDTDNNIISNEILINF